MKILLVVHQFFPHFTAGTEVLTLSVARELRELGHEVRIFSGHPSRDDLTESDRCDRYIHDGFEVYRFHHAYVRMAGQTSMIEVGSDNVLAAAYFSQILSEFRPDRVHYFHLNRLGTGLIVKAGEAGVRQSMTPTDFWVVCPTAQLRYPDGRLCNGPSRNAGNCVKHFAQNPQRAVPIRAIARALPTSAADAMVGLVPGSSQSRVTFIADINSLKHRVPKNMDRLNRLDSIMAPNAFMRAKLIEYGVDPRIIVDSAFGVQLPSVAVAEEEVCTARPLRLGFIGTLGPHKGAHVLVQAVGRLAPGSVSLRIYGNPLEFPEYARRLEMDAAAKPGISFLGLFPSEKIFDVLADLDVLIVPSLWYENTPLVIYSAQAARKIVVASDFPGISEVVRDGVNGLLFQPGNVAALAHQLGRLIECEALRNRLRTMTRPPKPITTYVDELLQRWQAP